MSELYVYTCVLENLSLSLKFWGFVRLIFYPGCLDAAHCACLFDLPNCHSPHQAGSRSPPQFLLRNNPNSDIQNLKFVTNFGKLELSNAKSAAQKTIIKANLSAMIFKCGKKRRRRSELHFTFAHNISLTLHFSKQGESHN